MSTGNGGRDDLVKREKCIWHLKFAAERSMCKNKRAVNSCLCPKHRDEGRARLGLTGEPKGGG